jgi:hypothetical protein
VDNRAGFDDVEKRKFLILELGKADNLTAIFEPIV